MARGSSPQSPGRKCLIFLVLCIISLLYNAFVLSPVIRDMFHTPMARYSLFVLQVPLNTNQLTNLCLFVAIDKREIWSVCLSM